MWGKSTSIDLYCCNPHKIRNKSYIKRFTKELCELIKMKRFGLTKVVHFGSDEKVAGFSMFQLIETSNISAHFCNATDTVYLDIFSCGEYDEDIVSKFAKQCFEATGMIIHTQVRI